jgi:transcriptional regulator of aroF, aroG, tyrA and aromatic amino acid transport
MRIKVHCQNRIGLLRDVLDLLVGQGIQVSRTEVAGKHNDVLYLGCPQLTRDGLQAVTAQLSAIAGVVSVRSVRLMPSERQHTELDTLLGALRDPVLSIDRGGAIVAANRAAVQLLEVPAEQLPGLALAHYTDDVHLPELLGSNARAVQGLRINVCGDAYLADIAPLAAHAADADSLAGSVVTLHRADHVGEGIYQVRKRELHGFDSIFHSSRGLNAVVEAAQRMATVDAPLLISGEPGTGKKLLARACHLLSPRAQAPFMVLDCAALSEPMIDTELFGYGPAAFKGARSEGRLGLLELAAGGSLLIDGVGALSPRLQAKLFSYLQEGFFYRVGSEQPMALDVRIICSTQIDLAGSSHLGEFSQALHRRLSVLTLDIPPLRDCMDGLGALERHFLAQASHQIGCPLPALLPSAQDKLRQYHWPGNVRQLEDVLFQAVALSEGRLIRAEHLRLADFGEHPPLGEFSLDGDLGEIVGRFEKAVLERLYRDFGTSRSLGKRLGVSHTTIANKLRAYGVSEGH